MVGDTSAHYLHLNLSALLCGSTLSERPRCEWSVPCWGFPNRNPIPGPVRLAVFKRAGGRCECCGERKPLELHHIRYWIPSHEHPQEWPIFGRETADDLKAYCRGC